MRPHNTFKARLALLVMLVCAGSVVATGQSDPTSVTTANSTGAKPYETYGGARENLNLATGNLNIVIPLLTLPGRNGHDLTVFASYDSKIWQLRNRKLGGNYVFWWEQENPAGWGVLYPKLTSAVVTQIDPKYRCRENYVLLMSDGTKYSFPKAESNCEKKNGQVWEPTGNFDGYPVAESGDAAFVRLDASQDLGVDGFSVFAHFCHKK